MENSWQITITYYHKLLKEWVFPDTLQMCVASVAGSFSALAAGISGSASRCSTGQSVLYNQSIPKPYPISSNHISSAFIYVIRVHSLIFIVYHCIFPMNSRSVMIILLPSIKCKNGKIMMNSLDKACKHERKPAKCPHISPHWAKMGQIQPSNLYPL